MKLRSTKSAHRSAWRDDKTCKRTLVPNPSTPSLACRELFFLFALGYAMPTTEQDAALMLQTCSVVVMLPCALCQVTAGDYGVLYWHCPFARDYRFSECCLKFVYIKTILWSTGQMQILSCDSDEDYVVTTSWHVFGFMQFRIGGEGTWTRADRWVLSHLHST